MLNVQPRPEVPPLPIDALLPALDRALIDVGSAVIVAPPGTGKTTRVPPRVAALVASGALGDAVDRGGRVIVLQPRRLAARASAARMAAERGENVGASVGYHVRFDRRVSAGTRIEVVTEGLLLRRIAHDPLLEGVAAVIIDELHERSLDVDMALAFVAEVRREVRPDLRVVAMSATLDAEPVAAFLGGATILRQTAALHPVVVHWDASPQAGALAGRVLAAVVEVDALLGPASAGAPGHMLVFLPGMGEILAAERALSAVAATRGLRVLPLHGSLPMAAQDRALAPSTQRKVVLSTDVAETSLTVEGLAAVIDGGWRRRPQRELALGVDRLVTERISAASAVQRAGRAGRQGPGICRRLYAKAEFAAFEPFDRAEIHRSDLSRPVLEVRAWGADPRRFGWLEAPAAEAIDAADRQLARLGALQAGLLTPTGRAMAALPLAPPVARVLIEGARAGRLTTAAAVCALASERDVMPRPPVAGGQSDLTLRLVALDAAAAARFAPATLSRWGLDGPAARRFFELRDALVRAAAGLASEQGSGRGSERDDVGLAIDDASEAEIAAWLAAGFPDRVGKRRAAGSGRVLLASGHGAVLGEHSVVRDAEFVVAVVVEAGRRGERTEATVPVAVAIAQGALAGSEQLETRWDARRLAVVQSLTTRYGALVLSERPADGRSDGDAATRLLAAKARNDPARTLSLDDDAAALLARLRWLSPLMPELAIPCFRELDVGGGSSDDDDDAHAAALAGFDLFDVLAVDRRSFEDLRRAPLAATIEAALPWALREALATHAPEQLTLPSRAKARVRYDGGGPTVSVRLQDAFGWTQTPTFAGGRAALRVELLAPNGRPAQVTSELGSFWSGGWSEVRKALRGRYPKHAWPEHPTLADARKPRSGPSGPK